MNMYIIKKKIDEEYIYIYKANIELKRWGKKGNVGCLLTVAIIIHRKKYYL